jgi:hypothetical protein
MDIDLAPQIGGTEQLDYAATFAILDSLGLDETGMPADS